MPPRKTASKGTAAKPARPQPNKNSPRANRKDGGGRKKAEPKKAQTPPPRQSGPLLIVGLGASAGGLQALGEFFSKMPAESGMAFVVVTHQHASHTSLMAELLGRKTTMRVVEVSNPTEVLTNHIYTGRRGKNRAMLNRILQPMEMDRHEQLQLPIDYFFRCLAMDQKERAIGIVLSGTGSDGTLGLKEIKAALGMVMVQEETSAQYGGMPHSAIATEMVDYVLSPGDMPKQLLAYGEAIAPAQRPAKVESGPSPDALQQIFVLVRNRTGHDFSLYKPSTIQRRTARRMNVHHVTSAKAYLRFLQDNPAERDLLFKELLIGVTSFFRDPDAFESLGKTLSELLKKKPDDYVFRAWVPGCSTGEE